MRYFFGATGAGADAGCCWAGGDCLDACPCCGNCSGVVCFRGAAFVADLDDMIDELPDFPEKYASVNEVSIKMIAAAVVILLMKVLPPPAPNTD